MQIVAHTYLETLFLLLGDNSERTRVLVKQFLEASDRNAGRREIISPDDEIIDLYKSLIKSVLDEKISQDNETALKILLLKIKNNDLFNSYPVQRDLLFDILTNQEKITNEQINEYLKRIRNTLIISQLDEKSKKMFAQVRKASEIKDTDQQELEIARLKSLIEESIKEIEHNQNTSEAKASDTYVNLKDAESVKKAIDTFIERNVKGVIKTGLHGLNKALGARGAFGLGDGVVFAAPSHHYKSGILVSIMVWTAIYNQFVVEPGKKPLIYFVSLENEVSQNLMDVFRMLYCRIEKTAVDPKELGSEFISQWIIDFFSKYNIDIIIDRYTPHEFSFGLFTKRYNSFVEQGYQLILHDLDYLSEVRGIDPGDPFSAQGQIQMIKENYLKFFNHAKTQGYLFTTGHQLTKRATELAAANRYAVKRFDTHLMADSSDVFRIIDVLFFLFIEKNVDGIKFLTVLLKKDRLSKDTPEKDKFFAYAFTEFGIMDDFEGPPQYVTDIDAWGVGTGARDNEVVESAMF